VQNAIQLQNYAKNVIKIFTPLIKMVFAKQQNIVNYVKIIVFNEMSKEIYVKNVMTDISQMKMEPVPILKIVKFLSKEDVLNAYLNMY
jgi:hypothetical protein